MVDLREFQYVSLNLLCGCEIMLEETSFSSCYKFIKMVLLKVVCEHCHAIQLDHATVHEHVCCCIPEKLAGNEHLMNILE